MTVRWLRPSVVAPLVCLLYAVLVALAAGHPLTWVTPSARLSPDELKPFAYSEWGYDGFYVYLIARDPLNAAPYLDAPSYRFQRMLLPGLARVLALGDAAALPVVLLALNLAALCAGTWALEHLLQRQGFGAWYAIGYAFSLPIFGSTRLSMTEPLAYALALLALVLALRGRWTGSAALFALAALTKETTLLFPAAGGFYLLYRRRWGQALVFGGVTLLPFVLWQGVIYGLFGRFGVGSGGATDTGFELLPFGAFFRLLALSGWAGALFWGVLLLPGVIVPTLWALARGWRDLRARRWTLFTQVLVFQALVIPFAPLSTFSEPGAIFRFIIGLQCAILLYAAHERLRRPLLYSTLWLFSGLIAVSSDYFLLRPP